MFTQSSSLGIEIGGYLKGSAEGPLGIGALLIIVLALIAISRWRVLNRGTPAFVKV